ncbi:hypothetical protein JL720_9611 [Aureococcus anophagefferens]|nr:hypothetical protein JL720_9611 [Aureococcus anophagefferens]
MKGYRYKFESRAESVRLYEEKYPGFMAKQDFVITTRRTAMTRTLADIFSFREKKVGGAIIAIDHTLKTLKGQKVAQEKVSKNRLTVWSNELGAPMIALSTATTSMDDDAFVAAANCYGTLLVDGRAPPKLCFLDNPARDAGGVLRRFDSLKDTSAPEKFSWSGPVVCIDDAAGDARALAALRDVRRVAVDMEWRAQPLSDVRLAAILRNEGIEKIGVNFQGDITRLTKQYEGVEVKGEIIELSDLANDTLKSQKRRCSTAGRRRGGRRRGRRRDDGADDDADDVGDLPNDDVEQEAPPDSVLAAATKLVVEYEGSNVAESLELPTTRPYKYFCTATSDAVYKIKEGELNRLNAHLRRRGMAEDQIKKIPRRYVRRMVRRFIPEPDVLERDLTKVYDFFKGLKDAETGQAFFRAGHKKRFDNEMRYVRKGYLSDHPDAELYVPKKKLATGFVRGALPHRFRHYDVFLEDKLAAQVEGLVERGVMAASPPGWRRTPYTKPFERYDVDDEGVVDEADFDGVLRSFGCLGHHRRACLRRFGGRFRDGRVDYLDFCRFASLGDARLEEASELRRRSRSATPRLLRPLLEQDPRGSGVVPVRLFRAVLLEDWRCAAELQLQSLCSRFAARDPRNVDYEHFVRHVAAALPSAGRRRRAGDGRSVSYADGVFPAAAARQRTRGGAAGSPRRSQPQPWFARRASPRRPASAPTWRDDGAADRRRPPPRRRWRDGGGGDDDRTRPSSSSLSPARNARRSPRRRARFAEPPSRDRTPSPKPAALEAWGVTRTAGRGRLPAAASPPRHAGAGAPPVFGAPGPDDHLFAGAPPPAAKRATARGFDDTWACPVCFYGDNKKGADACTICRSPNPASADAVVYVTCPACGHHNRRFGEDQKCEICDLELMSSRSARALASSVAKPERAVPWTRPDPKDHGGWRGLDESDDDDDAYPRAVARRSRPASPPRSPRSPRWRD